MPTTFYTEGEYYLIKSERDEMERRVSALEQLRPVWAHDWGTIGDQARQVALATLWQMLGATNQTEAVMKLRALLETRAGLQEAARNAGILREQVRGGV